MVVFSYSIFARKDKITREYAFLSILAWKLKFVERIGHIAFGELHESGFY
jgi:hypothetical protein